MNIKQAFKEVTGLSIEEGIQKAVEGGFQGIKSFNELDPILCDVHITDKDNQAASFCRYGMFLDPSYWVALGKSLGWSGTICVDWEGEANMLLWKYYWHRLIDLLATQREV